MAVFFLLFHAYQIKGHSSVLLPGGLDSRLVNTGGHLFMDYLGNDNCNNYDHGNYRWRRPRPAREKRTTIYHVWEESVLRWWSASLLAWKLHLSFCRSSSLAASVFRTAQWLQSSALIRKVKHHEFTVCVKSVAQVLYSHSLLGSHFKATSNCKSFASSSCSRSWGSIG